MALTDLKIELSYAGKGDKILKDFLLPSIANSQYYDRITSFYTIDSLIAISQGLSHLFQKNGRMRLIIGIHSFPKEIVDATLQQEFLTSQIEKIRASISSGILSLYDSLEKEQLATLAWMIKDHLLEVKVAATKGEGIFHPKTLILRDEQGNRVVAVGSPNETRSGLGGNFEQIMVAKSWESLSAVETQEKFFSTLWNGMDDEVLVSDISEETASIILSCLGDEYKIHPHRIDINGTAILRNALLMPSNFFVSGNIPSLYMHQERAVLEALSRWPVRVMFSDEVGLGKTFEVAAAMIFLRMYCNVNRVLILTPKAVQTQWQDELKGNFGIDAWIYDSGSKSFINAEGITRNVSGDNPLAYGNPDIVLMSVQFARGNKTQGHIFSQERTILPDLLIVDEAHSARVSKGLDGKKHKTIVYSMIEDVARRIPHLILATATPMQKDSDEYHSMLKLLGLPKSWNLVRNYQTSLRLLMETEVDLSDALSAATMLRDVVEIMKPNLQILTSQERTKLLHMMSQNFADKQQLGEFVQNNWKTIQKAFIKLHPAHLLTIRNTRRSLTQIGYKFPKRNLYDIKISNSFAIQDFYYRVYSRYLKKEGFSIEEVLFPNGNRNIGFVKTSYQQRIASSLYSCIESLARRQKKVSGLKSYLEKNREIINSAREVSFVVNWKDENWDYEDWPDDNPPNGIRVPCSSFKSLLRAAENEYIALNSLISEASQLYSEMGDLKIREAISLAKNKMTSNDSVLLFSRYTDTVDALIRNFESTFSSPDYVYGVYTGQEAYINKSGVIEYCDKHTIKRSLASGEIKILFCSDAASEGLNLQSARILINVDVPWTPARLEQRIGRVARLGQKADEVEIYNIWYPNSIEYQMYQRIQKRLYNTNIAVGEFPDVMAEEIKDSILEGDSDDDLKIEELRNLRNSTQVQALERLWNPDVKELTTSEVIRQRLLRICKEKYANYCVDVNNETIIQLPDGVHFQLTADIGSPSTISLSSDVLNEIDCVSDSICVNKDEDGRPCSFSLVDGMSKRIKFESVLKLCLDESFEASDYLEEYPQMLPNNRLLDLSYVIETQVPRRPEMWHKEM